MNETNQRETDLVLNPNEYAFVLDKTKGLISCVVGSYKMSLSTSDELVRFNQNTKRFEQCDSRVAITTFTSAPENWYVQLKNPAEDYKHPTTGTSNQLPTLNIGQKINIPGPVSFALYPGQMARVIKGHRLNTNQYLLIKVYDPEALKESDMYDFFCHEEKVTLIDDDGNETGEQTVSRGPQVGEIFLIKGTERQFFIPPTGVEVIPCDNNKNDYVRDAITLERLEYCILMNERGNKKYIHGPAVVFPEPDEKVVLNKATNSLKFRAIELSDISGVYVKIICDCEDGEAGDELFITGKDQKIYYPRAEHSIISYDGNIVHHAVAIPEGEGRYVMDRMTGKIRMEKGPSMFLPDPRKEVIVNRKLTRKQCELWYPGNTEVLEHNCPSSQSGMVEDLVSSARYLEPRLSSSIGQTVMTTALDNRYVSMSNSYTGPSTYIDTYDDSDATVDSGIERKNKHTKLRSITIDNKYDGVVSIDIWTGYAVNVVSKDGKRKVVIGPQTYLMEYDESLEVLELSTGKPKTTDNLLKTVYLRVENNKISDLIKVETKDFVSVLIKVSYCVDFIDQDNTGKRYKDKWFSVENYVKYMCDRERSLIKREAKKYTVEEFYENASDIVRKVALDINDEKINVTEDTVSNPINRTGRFFKENGMLVHDIEVLSVRIDDNDVSRMIDEHQKNVISESLKLTASKKELESAQEIANLELMAKKIQFDKDKEIEELRNKMSRLMLDNENKLADLHRAEEMKDREAKQKLQSVEDAIHSAMLGRQKAEINLEIEKKDKMYKLDMAYEENTAKNAIAILGAVSPQLAAAMEERSNAELMTSLVESMSPYAMAEGRPVEEYVNKLLRGTSMEEVISKVTKNRRDVD